MISTAVIFKARAREGVVVSPGGSSRLPAGRWNHGSPKRKTLGGGLMIGDVADLLQVGLCGACPRQPRTARTENWFKKQPAAELRLGCHRFQQHTLFLDVCVERDTSCSIFHLCKAVKNGGRCQTASAVLPCECGRREACPWDPHEIRVPNQRGWWIPLFSGQVSCRNVFSSMGGSTSEHHLH